MTPVSRRNSKDLAAGILFIIVGSIGLFASFRYEVGSATEMGPGYFPALIFSALVVIGLATSASAGSSTEEGLEAWAWRPLIIILAALTLFGLIVDSLGFVVSSALLILFASFAGGRLSVTQLALLILLITTFSAVLFVRGLGLPIPVWPRMIS